MGWIISLNKTEWRSDSSYYFDYVYNFIMTYVVLLCCVYKLELNLALGSDHKLVCLGSDEMFSFGDFGRPNWS